MSSRIVSKTKSVRAAVEFFKLRSLSTVPLTTSSSSPSSSQRLHPHPPLVKVPSLPLFGSIVPQYSGTPPFNPSKMYEYHPEMRKRFGDFYSFGMPGFGAGLHGTIYSTIDPDEMLKVVRSEGAHPSGIVERLWVMRKALKDADSALVQKEDYGLLDRGERWKKHRTFLQTDMLCPRAAKGYLSGILDAASLASKGAPSRSDDLNAYLNYATFDMFSSFMFGELTQVADKTTVTDPENEAFCKAAIEAMQLSTKIMRDPYENAVCRYLGIDTKGYKRYQESFDTVRRIGRNKLTLFAERFTNNQLNEDETKSYLARAIQRRAEERNDISEEEMFELCLFGLFAAIDTTTTVTAWNLVHLALNPNVQDKLHNELSQLAASTDGTLNSDAFAKSNTPYLHAILRETHRLTPPFPQAMVKSNVNADITIHGITIPTNSTIALDHVTYDPDYVDNPREFRPERWHSDAVENRVGTKSEIVDHPLLRDPFGQGARRCPGSRVAKNEIMAMISSLVLDWKISSPVGSLEDVRYESAPFIQPIIPKLEFVPRNA